MARERTATGRFVKQPSRRRRFVRRAAIGAGIVGAGALTFFGARRAARGFRGATADIRETSQAIADVITTPFRVSRGVTTGAAGIGSTLIRGIF